MSETDVDEMKEMIKDLPEWLKFDDKTGQYTIETREGKYIMEEQTGEVVKSCENMAAKLKRSSFEYFLIPRSSIEPKLSDRSLDEMKGSTLFRLKTAMMFIYGLNELF